jgi:hypothetical protein
VITATVAYRAGRKTPYEVLKTLVEILEKSDQVANDDRQVLAMAVHREIQRIDRLNQARIEGFWAYQRERIAQLEPSSPVVAIVGAIVFSLAVCAKYFYEH